MKNTMMNPAFWVLATSSKLLHRSASTVRSSGPSIGFQIKGCLSILSPTVSGQVSWPLSSTLVIPPCQLFYELATFTWCTIVPRNITIR